MKISFTLVALSWVVAVTPAAAQTTQIVKPQLINVPVSFGKDLHEFSNGPKVSFSADGQYLMANTDLEAKVWHMPDGELVYRFNTAMMTDDPTRRILNYRAGPPVITSDGKYLFTNSTGQDFGMMPVALETGELVGNGQVKDSLRNGTYQYRRELLGSRAERDKMLSQFRSLKISGHDDFSDDDKLSIHSMVASATYPGEIIVAFWRSFAGSRGFINDNLKESVKEVRAKQKRSSQNVFRDIHVARYKPATNTSVYLGNVLKGAFNMNLFPEEFFLALSPVDDIVYVQGIKSPEKLAYSRGRVGSPTFASINSYSGAVLWEPSTTIKNQFSFDGYNDFGFPVFKEIDNYEVLSKTVFEPNTGKVVHKYAFSAPLHRSYVHNIQWNAVVATEQLSDKSWSIALYDGSTGKHLLSFPDEQASRNSAAASDAEIKRINDYNTAAQKAMHDHWDRQAAQWAREAVAEQQKKAADAITHAANFKPCPSCKGTGVWVNSGVAKAYRRVSYSEGRSLSGSRTTIESVESSSGGYWEQRSACLQCWGKGEIRK